jgi:hypothetical protein
MDKGWNVSKLMYYLFRHADEKGEPICCTQRHAQQVSTFIRGTSDENTRTATIIQFWMEDPAGKADRTRIPEEFWEDGLMYSLSSPWKEIRHARPALTSWAVQLVKQHLVSEAAPAVKKDGGLHGCIRDPRS